MTLKYTCNLFCTVCKAIISFEDEPPPWESVDEAAQRAALEAAQWIVDNKGATYAIGMELPDGVRWTQQDGFYVGFNGNVDVSLRIKCPACPLGTARPIEMTPWPPPE